MVVASITCVSGGAGPGSCVSGKKLPAVGWCVNVKVLYKLMARKPTI